MARSSRIEYAGALYHVTARGDRLAGLKLQDLPRLKGSDARKVAIARVIWEKTTVKMSWIADGLSMRSAGNVSQQLRRSKPQTRALSKDFSRWRDSHDS